MEKAVAEPRKRDDPPPSDHGDIFHMELDSVEEDVHVKRTLGNSFLHSPQLRSLQTHMLHRQPPQDTNTPASAIPNQPQPRRTGGVGEGTSDLREVMERVREVANDTGIK